METAKRDIKETMEFLNGLGVLAVLAGKITADGKIGVDDLKHLVDAAKDFQVVLDGVADVSDAMAELKELDESEAIQVIAKVFSILKEFKDAKAA